MSFPRYPEYKDSGVEWLGQVPAHWTLTSLRRVSNDWCDGPFGSGLKSTHYVDAGVRVIRLQNIRGYGFDDSDAAFIEEAYYRTALGDHDVVAGDLLLAGLGDENNTVGRACVAPDGIEPALVKADCFRFRLDSGAVLPHFAALQLTAGAAFDAGILSSGSTRSRIPLSVMASRALVFPTLEEQRAIASFLDHETAKIDALVAEQERLITLLKEKRQAVISHAVTKGLNPNAPMKDSGVDWLGSVPAAWTITPLRYLVHSVVQGWSPQCESYAADLDSEYGVLKVGAVNGGVLDPSENKKLPPELEPPADLAIRAGDLMISRANTRELVGSAAVADADYPRLLLCDKLYRLRFLRSSQLPKFIARYLATPAIRQQIELGASGASASMLNISQSVILDLPVPVPPEDEMMTVLEFCAQAAQQTSELIAQAKGAVDLLLERRAALITAAVTGQIDVRGLVWTEAA
ncbi:MAG: restriction endonuclease subunit S [Gemmatimonadaceae bacterium]